jgi:quaternary ammonium compound-resistance protein SugE
MAWVYLIVAGIMEWGWPLGLKFAWTGHSIRIGPAVIAVASVLGSGLFLLLAQRTIPIGTAYAAWTGIGAIGTFVLGIILLGEPAQVARFFCVGLIVMGVVGLKVLSAH